MIRTVLTLRMGTQDMQDTTFLINDTQIGFLAQGGRRNHVLSSHRYLQLVAGLKSASDDPSLATAQQRENLRLWQRCSRDVQQRGLNILTQAAAHYGLRPDWLIGIDDHYMHAWLLERYGIYLMRDGELFQVEPVSDNQIKIPDSWRGHLHQSTIEIMEGDYYLFLPPDFFDIVTSEEVQNILSGLQQLSVKINELVEIARLRKYDLTDTWMALQIQKIEPDTQQPVSLVDQWKSFRKNLKKPSPEETARLQAGNSSLRQTTSIADSGALGIRRGKTHHPDIADDENHIDTPYSMYQETGINTHEEEYLSGVPGEESEFNYREERAAGDKATEIRNRNRQPVKHSSGKQAKSGQKGNGLSIIDKWLGWSKEKKLLSVIIALAVIVLFAWGISSLFGGDDADGKNAAQTSESTLLPTPTPLPPTVTTTVVPVEIKMAVNVRSLNFRESPGTEAPLITTLPEGSEVTKIGDSDEDGWIKVLLDDGTEAFAFAEYLTEINQENTEETQQ